MAFTQLSKALHVNLCKMISQPSLQRCLLIQANRTVSTTPGLSYRNTEAPLRVGPVISRLVQTDRRRCISFTATTRNKSSPDDRDKSVSRFQGGSPKPSTAQKGRQHGNHVVACIILHCCWSNINWVQAIFLVLQSAWIKTECCCLVRHFNEDWGAVFFCVWAVNRLLLWFY